MVKPTFMQKVLGRPSQRYYQTANKNDLEHTHGHRGTTGELIQPTIDTNTIDTDIDDQFFTPASSPFSSNQNSPSHTPPHSAASSSVSLADNVRSSQSLPDHSTASMISLLPASPGKHPPDRKLTYTDEDWARDVRWLVAPPIDSNQKPKSKSAKRRSAPPTVSLLPSSPSSMQSNSHRVMHASPSRHPPPPRPAKMKPLGKAKISTARTVIGMTALLEVEEDLDHDSSLSHTLPSPESSVQRRSFSGPRRPVESLTVDHRPRVSSPLSSPRLTTQRSLSSPDLLFAADEPPSKSKPTSRSSTTDVSSSSQHRPFSVASRPHSTFSASTSKSPYTIPAPNVLDALAAHVTASDSHDALPSSGTRGYTGLVLPRAATSPALALNNTRRPWKLGKSRSNGAGVRDSIGVGLGFGDQVDLSRAGLAQTTMASVEIVRGIAAGSGSDRKTHKSRGSVFGMGWFQKDKSASKANGEVHNAVTDTPLGFTAYRSPPVYVGGGSVLVQVWGVGLDGTDARLAGIHPARAGSSIAGAPYGMRTPKNSEKDKGRSPPVGYIPGRSFVGRVLEVGWEVGEDVAKRGDWVVGLMSVHKCGALAEFMLADRHRVHRIPNPFMRSKYPFSSSTAALNEAEGDVHKRHDSPVFPIEEETLSINELALVPLCGVPAYRGVRTFHQITHSMGKPQLPYGNSHNEIHPLLPPRSDKHDFNAGGGQEELISVVQPSDSRPRALILRAHDGAGAFAAQMLIREGWSVWAHVPVPFMLPGPPSEIPDELKDEDEEKELDNQRNILRRIEDRLRGWGVDEVLFVPVTSMPLSALFDLSTSALEGMTSWSSPSIHFPQSTSSSPSISPSPFSRSATSSPLSSPYSHILSSGHFSSASPPSSSSHQHAFTTPYSFTPLPLAPYDCEQGSIVSLISYLNRSRVRLDAILDTVGGREIWEAGRSLLGRPVRDPSRQDVDAQFTTLVGDTPDRVVSTAGDNFRAGVRSLRLGATKEQHPFEDSGYHETVTHGHKDKKTKLKPRPVNYSWVNVVSDIDWEGSDVHDTLCAVLRLSATEGVRPVVGAIDFPGPVRKDKGKRRAIVGMEELEEGMVGKVVPFENTPEVFMPGGGLDHGGTIVSRVAG